MNSKKQKSIFVFFFSFLISLGIIYMSFSFYEVETLTKWRDDHYLDRSKLSAKLKEDLKNTNREYFEEGNPFGWVYFQYMTMTLCIDYMVKEQDNLIKMDYKDFLSMYLEAYSRRYILVTTFAISNTASIYSYKILHEKLNLYISEWEKGGGKREGKWWKDFEKSKQYRDFVNEIEKGIENPNGKNISILIEEINTLETSDKSSLRNITMRNYMIPELQREANLVYENLKIHSTQGDYVSTLVDSYMIFSIHEFLTIIENKGLYGYDGSMQNYDIEEIKNKMYFEILLIFLLPLIIGGVITILYVKKNSK